MNDPHSFTNLLSNPRDCRCHGSIGALVPVDCTGSADCKSKIEHAGAWWRPPGRWQINGSDHTLRGKCFGTRRMVKLDSQHVGSSKAQTSASSMKNPLWALAVKRYSVSALICTNRSLPISSSNYWKSLTQKLLLIVFGPPFVPTIAPKPSYRQKKIMIDRDWKGGFQWNMCSDPMMFRSGGLPMVSL